MPRKPTNQTRAHDWKALRKNSVHSEASLKRARKRAQKLVELMMKEMEAGLLQPELRGTQDWEWLFGPKQSMVSNLQKLVGTLKDLPSGALPEAEIASEPEAPPITTQEMLLLEAWIKETNAMPVIDG